MRPCREKGGWGREREDYSLPHSERMWHFPPRQTVSWYRSCTATTRPLPLSFWIFRTPRTNHHRRRRYHHHYHLRMTKRNELVATAHLKKKRTKEIQTVCRYKKTGTRRAGRRKNPIETKGRTRTENADCLVRKIQERRKGKTKDNGFKVIVLERWSTCELYIMHIWELIQKLY